MDRNDRLKTLMAVPWEEEGGGVASVVESVAKYLKSAGHEVMFFYPGSPVVLASKTTPQGFRAVQLRLSVPFVKPRPILSALAFPVLFPIALLQLLWFLRREQIRVVNVHYPVDHFVYFAVCRRLLGIRLVTSIHGGDAFYQGRPREKYSRIFRFLIASSDLIVLPSATYRNRLLEAFPHIQDKTIHIHNGVNLAFFSFVENVESEPKKNRYILSVTHLRDYKGVDILLHAARPLLASDPSLDLVVAGDGPLLRELEDLASSLGIRNQTRFVGLQSAKAIAGLLKGCELMVLPSREESFGIALIEAMACRKAVVATEVGGVPEIVEHEISGILVEPENAAALSEGMRRVLTDGHLRRTLEENGYSRVMERFCVSHTTAAYEDAFASLWGFRQSASPNSPPGTGGVARSAGVVDSASFTGSNRIQR
jgi:glycosyltransferase involved in cell wall biosynthesis